MADYFETALLECQWRGIGFPAANFRVRISHDIAQHKRPDQDGARVEATGRNPLTFSCVAPMRNGIRKASHESWDLLYPDTWHRLIVAMSDRSTGILQHPSFGGVTCKPVSAESQLDSGKRDGEDVSLEWIEYTESDIESDDIFQRSGDGVQRAIELDDDITKATAPIKDPDAGVTFEESLRSIAGVFDTASLLSKKTFGAIDRVLYRLDVIEASVRTFADPQNWPVKQSISRLRDTLITRKREALKAQRDVKFYIVPSDTTLASIAPRVGNSVSDLIRLNPSLVATPLIPSRTVIRFFAVAA